MALKSINLDDRRFQDLMEAALERAARSCPEWTDLTPGDPGRVLLELFSFLTEVMIYRLNRLPEKAYVEFLRLLGVTLQAPAAAVTTLRFSRKAAGERAVEIPRGTRVAAERAAGGEPPTFATAETVRIEAGATSADVRAFHCVWIEAELVGHGTGFPGLSVQVAHPPIVAPTGDGLDLVVGVEAGSDKLEAGTSVIRHGDKAFRIWKEGEDFVDLAADRCVYLADRAAGCITFAPALRMRGEDGTLAAQASALAEVPATGREIRVWYRSGGGAEGNVAAGTLTKLKDTIPGVTLEVTNPAMATGGRAGETLEHAMRRGPQELHSLRRAVTAQDFELLTLRSASGIDRAYAHTMIDTWKYAPRGTVELICMPHVPPERYGTGPLTRELLEAHATPEALEQVRAALEPRKSVGTHVVARYGRCKNVRVKTRVVVFPEEDSRAVHARVLERLYDTITPLGRGGDQTGWGFGQPLSAYDVYRILSSEPGVKYVDPIRLCVDEVPAADVSALSVDAYQPRTWYAASGDAVFRSLNDGDGWEQIARIPDSAVRLLQAYPREAAGRSSRAGLIAAIAEFAEQKSRVFLSRDCGESWQEIGARPEFRIEDMAWMDRDGEPALLLATEKGLYELAARADADPVPVLVDEERSDLGFYAVAVSTDAWGNTCVALAARAQGGVYLSDSGGKPGTFKRIGLENELVSVLAVQHEGSERYLWAGLDAVGEDPGQGCARWQLPHSPEGWQRFGTDWQGGGCQGLAFVGTGLLAATRRHGVLRLDANAHEPRWSAPDVQCGLPMETLKRMRAVDFIAASPRTADGATVGIMAAGGAGVYRSADEGSHYELCTQREFADRVTLPATWLLCSEEHDIEVSHGEARRD